MEISKYFKIYINILICLFLFQKIGAASPLSDNLVLHQQPKKLPELIIQDSDFNSYEINNKKGNLMVLNFWATWCVPCKEEMPSLNQLSKKYPEIVVIPINLENPNIRKAQRSFSELGAANLKIFFDPKFETVKKLNLRGVPISVIINKDLEEIASAIGEINFQSKKFEELIKNNL